MIETLFVNNASNIVPKDSNRRPVLPPFKQENRVLDAKKSQNIAILLRALDVTQEEVSEVLLDGKGSYPLSYSSSDILCLCLVSCCS